MRTSSITRGRSKKSPRKKDKEGKRHHRRGRGSLFIVGIGPGDIKDITPRARVAIENSDIIIGYKSYLPLIKDLTKGKEIISSGMGDEVARCQGAIDLARSGKKVAIISSGDPGIYGMAGPLLELLKSDDLKLKIEIISGIPAICAAASLLGAPLMNDFCAISLSDLLTPWNLIEKRINAAVSAGFVIGLYNPKSSERIMQIEMAREIILKHRDPLTPVGIVRNAGRRGEDITITNLKEMLDHKIDMRTILIVGNPETFTTGRWMITPRGYSL